MILKKKLWLFLLRNYCNWSKQGCLRDILEFLSLVHMKPGTFCGEKELRCNLTFWLRGGKRLLITKSYLLLLPSLSQLIKTPHFLPLYSLNFSKNEKHQGIFLLFHLNQSSVWTDLSELPWGKCRHKDHSEKSRQQVPTSPSSQSPGLPQCGTDWSVLGSPFRLSGRWNVNNPHLYLHSNTPVPP